MTNEELKARYGWSEHNNYHVIDTIGVPHPYCITEKHVVYVSDHHSGMLTTDTIRAAEKRGHAKCGTRGCTLTIDQHEQALLVACNGPLHTDDGIAVPELHAYLLKCNPLCEADKFAGYAFIKEG